jgi:dolichol-phosphate mannosyltransferase
MKPLMKNKACIVMPTYNEVQNIPIIIPWIFEEATKIGTHEVHLLIVDDNSPDGTQEVVRRHMDKFPNLHLITGEKKGLGEAYKRGFDHAIKMLEPDLIFEMDADLQHSPNILPLFISLANHGFTMIIGSRFAPGGSTPNFSMWRRFQSLFGNWLIRVFGGLPRIHDCTSGYRCIKTELIKKCDLSFLSTRGYSFQSSLLFELLRNGARVIEIPIEFPDRVHGGSKLSFRDQVEFLLNIAKIRFRKSEEFIKFCVVGGSGVFVNMGIYVLITRLMDVLYYIASPIAIELSILWNFAWNNFWTFKNREASATWMRRLIRFHVVAGVAGLANYLILLVLVSILGVWDVLANLIGIVFGTLINYFMNSLWTWREMPKDSGQFPEGLQR